MENFVDESFNSILDLFKQNVFNTVMFNNQAEKQLRKIHDGAYGMAVWKNEINSDEQINEILSNSIQILHIGVFKDGKVTAILTRNIIDNFLKYLKRTCEIVDVNYTTDLYTKLKKYFDEKNLKIVKDKLIEIWGVYQSSSDYVHSTNSNNLSLFNNVKSYSTKQVDLNYKSEVKNLEKVLKAINFILIILEPNKYDKMDKSIREFIFGYNSEDSKAIIREHFYKVKIR
ncbi:hypothetical protein [Lysinibacillus fusiformis]